MKGMVLSLLLCANMAYAGDASPTEFRKILFLGNSITLHGPAKAIGWEGDWGMAASAPEKDCVHLVTQALKRKDGTLPEILIKNVATFERQYTTYDTSALVREAAAFQPDLIVVGIGENVRWLGTDLSKRVKDAEAFNSNQAGGTGGPNTRPLSTAEAKVQFKDRLVKLLNDIRADRKPVILVRSSFYTDAAKDEALKQACLEVGGLFVHLGGLDKHETNFARSDRPFKHAGVGAHPATRGCKRSPTPFSPASDGQTPPERRNEGDARAGDSDFPRRLSRQ